jgi:hypothetical protein
MRCSPEATRCSSEWVLCPSASNPVAHGVYCKGTTVMSSVIAPHGPFKSAIRIEDRKRPRGEVVRIVAVDDPDIRTLSIPRDRELNRRADWKNLSSYSHYDDKPFTGLDAPVRDRLRRELRQLQREAGLCTVIVTHDPEEAVLLADGEG